MAIDVQFPACLAGIFQPYRFKSLRGGRDGGKSWGVAAALLEIGAAEKKFVVCARETMNSIADSVHRLLESTIDRLQLQDQYHVGQALIRHRGTGTEFVFKGVHHNPEAIKSLEGADILWVEEAQSVSDDSWRQMIPTMRRPNSEIWLTWNPKLETDPTWKRFVVDPPPGCLDIQMNFSDNPWASEVLRPEREKMQRDKPDEYAHVWLGQPLRQLEGAIYAQELRLAESQGRIGKVPYDPEIPVYTAWDLGDSDIMAIWFIQPVMGQYRVIDYMEDRHKPLSYFLTALEGKGYRYALDFFPWDAASKVLIGSLEESMRTRGRTVRVLDRMSREVGIDAVREMLGTCWFDVLACAEGLQRLRYYRYGETKIVGPDGRAVQTREPIHDDNSHGADALRSAAMGFRRKLDKPKPLPKPVTKPTRYYPAPTRWS